MIKYNLIKKYAEEHPEKIALIDGDVRITWYEFMIYTDNIINKIEEDFSFQNENPSLFLSNNSANLAIIGAALSTCGISFGGVDHALEISIIRSIIKKIEAKNIFVSSELFDNFSCFADSCNIIIIEDYIKEANIKMQDAKFEDHITQIKREFHSYGFTSGTTGVPKIVHRTKSFDLKRFDYLNKRYGFNGSDVHLVCMPMYHVSATGWLRQFLSLGCTTVIHNYKDSFNLCEAIHSENITTTLFSSVMLKELVNHTDDVSREKYFSSLNFIITGGKNCTPYLKAKAIQKFGDIFHEYYGTTETGINTLIDSCDEFYAKGSVGCEFEGNEIVILDSELNTMNNLNIGRIAIYSYMNMDGYLGEKSEFININGKKFILTSDYGYKNLEGYLFIVQRAKVYVKCAYDFYAMENHIFNLDYISDVCVYQVLSDDEVNIDLVLEKYRPHSEIKIDVEKIGIQFGISNVNIKVRESLNYTKTGKMKFLNKCLSTQVSLN